MMNKTLSGYYIVPDGANVWPHEIETAKAFISIGSIVEFIPDKGHENHVADAYIDGILWEMKAPRGSKLSCVEKNLRRGSKQCENIVFDSRRMKQVPDKAIERELSAQLKRISRLKQIKFVNRHAEIIDIK